MDYLRASCDYSSIEVCDGDADIFMILKYANAVMLNHLRNRHSSDVAFY